MISERIVTVVLSVLIVILVAVVPVGWPPLAETLRTTVALGIPIHV